MNETAALADSHFALDVDLRNPGQFFACCGLLELAARLWPGCEGWFETFEGRGRFVLANHNVALDPIGDLLGKLCADRPIVELAEDYELYAGDRQPVVVCPPFGIRLDWWLQSYRGGEKSELKVWAGQMTPRANLAMLQSKLRLLVQTDSLVDRARLFSARIPGSGMGIDPATAWTAINVGFSPDEQNVDVLTAPATEILAIVGLQRCRPVMDRKQRRRWFSYRAWGDPLEISVAPAAVVGVGRSVGAFAFPVEMRNAQYGNFGWAKSVEERS